MLTMMKRLTPMTMAVCLVLPAPAVAQDDPSVVPEDITPYLLGPDDYIAGSRIEVYQDFAAWFGEDRVVSVLDELGYIPGVDYGVNPTSDLQLGFASDVDVVIVVSNSINSAATQANVNHPDAQANMDAFARAGGVLVMHTASTSPFRRLLAPGLPAPSPGSFGLSPDLVGAIDHPMVIGPDNAVGGGDDWTQATIQPVLTPFSAFGYLAGLPATATVLIEYAGNPILAEYPLGDGLVIATTMNLEFGNAGEPGGFRGTPRRLLRNEIHYATTLVLCSAPVATASLTLVASGDDEGTNGDDDDEGMFVVLFGISNPGEACEGTVCTAVLVCGGQAIPVEFGQIVEIEIDDEGCSIEMEDGILEIEGPDVFLLVTCTNSAGEDTAMAFPEGLAPDNDTEDEDDD